MEEYNRKNVNRIKKMILFVVFLLCTVPTVLCIYLSIRLNHVEKQLAAYTSPTEESQATAGDAVSVDAQLYNDSLYNEEIFAENMDLQAYDQIEKDTSEITSLTLGENFNSGMENVNTKKVYLTFDDGPSEYTDEILDILKEENVKATFFVVARDESYYDAYRRIVAEGHTLAMHSYTHVYSSVYASLDSFKEDVDSLHDLLYDVTGVDVKYYRFPGGSSNTVSKVDIQSCIQYLDEQGYTYFDWNSLNGDAVTENLTPDELNANVMKYVRGNTGDSIVLMHDLSTKHATVEALEDLIHTLKEEGYELCPIDENTTPVHHVKDASTETSAEILNGDTTEAAETDGGL